MPASASQRHPGPFNAPLVFGTNGVGTAPLAGQQIDISFQVDRLRQKAKDNHERAMVQNKRAQENLDSFLATNGPQTVQFKRGSKHFEMLGSKFTLPRFSPGLRLPIAVPPHRLPSACEELSHQMNGLLGADEIQGFTEWYKDTVEPAVTKSKNKVPFKVMIAGEKDEYLREVEEAIQFRWLNKANVHLFEGGQIVDMYLSCGRKYSETEGPLALIPRFGYATTTDGFEEWFKNQRAEYQWAKKELSASE